MLEFSCKKIKIGFSFTFFAVVAAVAMLNKSFALKIAAALVCCVIHELGHISMMCFFEAPPESILFYAGGIKIIPDRKRLLSDFCDVMILAAGCAANFICAGAVCLISGRTGAFVDANIFLGLFNLLPMRYFDGGRILSIAAGEKAAAAVRIVFIAVLAAILLFTLINGELSISLAVTLCYITLAEVMSAQRN